MIRSEPLGEPGLADAIRVTPGQRILTASITGLFLTLPLAATLTLDIGFPLTIAHGFAAVVAFTFVWVDRSHLRMRTWLPASLFLAFCAAYALSFVLNLGGDLHQFPWSTGRNAPGIRSATKLVWLLGNVAIALVIANAVRKTNMERKAIRALGLGAVLCAIYGLYQVVGETHGFFVPVLPGTEFIAGTASYWIVLRAKSTFLEPSYFGAYLAAALPFVVVGWIRLSTRRRPGAKRATILLSLVAAGILVTFSITGWLSAAIAAIVLCALAGPLGLRTVALRLGASAVAAGVVVVILVPGVPGAISALIDKGALASGVADLLPGASLGPTTTLGPDASGGVVVLPGPTSSPTKTPGPDTLPPEVAERSAFDRAATTGAAFRMFATSPIVGIGPGNFGLRYPEFLAPDVAAPTQLQITNNVYAELLAESGLVGFSTYFGGFFGLAVLAMRAYSREKGRHKLELGAGVAAMAAMAAAFLTGPTFTLLYQWAILGLVGALVARNHRVSGTNDRAFKVPPVSLAT